jgi:hypothetical protein
METLKAAQAAAQCLTQRLADIKIPLFPPLKIKNLSLPLPSAGED